MIYTVKNIFGFNDKIYQLLPFLNQKLEECWGSKIDFFEHKKENDKETIKFTFANNGDKYAVVLKAQNDKGDFKGDIICDNEKVGFCFFTLYKNPTRTLLWGDWNENGFQWYTLIELIK